MTNRVLLQVFLKGRFRNLSPAMMHHRLWGVLHVTICGQKDPFDPGPIGFCICTMGRPTSWSTPYLFVSQSFVSEGEVFCSAAGCFTSFIFFWFAADGSRSTEGATEYAGGRTSLTWTRANAGARAQKF
jgi:hypothetical protein